MGGAHPVRTIKLINSMQNLKINTIELVPSEDLMKMYQNAWKTYAGCIGNHKSAMNKQFALEYEMELQSRGIEIKRNLEEGVYNGIGSY